MFLAVGDVAGLSRELKLAHWRRARQPDGRVAGLSRELKLTLGQRARQPDGRQWRSARQSDGRLAARTTIEVRLRLRLWGESHLHLWHCLKPGGRLGPLRSPSVALNCNRGRHRCCRCKGCHWTGSRSVDVGLPGAVQLGSIVGNVGHLLRNVGHLLNISNCHESFVQTSRATGWYLHIIVQCGTFFMWAPVAGAVGLD